MLYAAGTVVVPFAEFAHRVLPAASVTVLGRALASPSAFFVLFAAFAVCGVADSIRLPASMALFIEEGDAVDATAGSMSIRSVAWKLGQVVGPLVMGIVWDATSVFSAFAVAAAMILASTAAFLVLDRPSSAPTPS